MKLNFILLLFLIPLLIKSQDISGLYIGGENSNCPDVVLNLYEDSSFNYFFIREGGYGITIINRCGKYGFENNVLVLKSIIEKDSITINDSLRMIYDKVFDYFDYFELQSDTYSYNPEICINTEDSLWKLFPDLKVFLDFDFKRELRFDQNNLTVFEYPKDHVLGFINLRSRYFNIDIDFDFYYHQIDKNNWRVSKNLLNLKMKNNILEFKQMEFKTFAKYFVDKDQLELKFAREPDWTMMHKFPVTLILKKQNDF